MNFHFSIQVSEYHFGIAAKFPDNLPARATGRSEFFGFGDNRDCVKATVAFRERFENGYPLSAYRQSVTGIFNVAARINRPGFRKQCRAYAKSGTIYSGCNVENAS